MFNVIYFLWLFIPHVVFCSLENKSFEETLYTLLKKYEINMSALDRLKNDSAIYNMFEDKFQKEKSIKMDALIDRMLMEKKDYDKISLQRFLNFTALYGNPVTIQKLIDKGADINGYLPWYGTPFFSAIQSGNRNVIEKLIELQVDIHAVDFKIFGNALHWVSCQNLIDVAEYLILNQVDLNVKNMFGQTPLFFAVFFKRPELIKLFLEHGAYPTRDALVLLEAHYPDIDILEYVKNPSFSSWNGERNAVSLMMAILPLLLYDMADGGFDLKNCYFQGTIAWLALCGFVRFCKDRIPVDAIKML